MALEDKVKDIIVEQLGVNADQVTDSASFIEDLGASAAYKAASQAGRLSANEPAFIGSIGVYQVVEDTSEMAEKMGVKVHVISTGEFKGAGVPGAPVTDAVLQDVQNEVDALNELFMKAVAKGRHMDIRTVRKLADGRVHIAAKAQSLGLIDAVESFDDALAGLTKLVAPRRRVSAASAERRVRLAKARG